MDGKAGRIRPDAIETLAFAVGGLIFAALAVQSVDDLTTRGGLAQLVGIVACYALFVWWAYARPLSNLALSDPWAGLTLLFILGVIAGSVLVATGRATLISFAPALAIGFVLAATHLFQLFRRSSGR
ncbi:hypothetical protein G6M89_13555 [Natronolimnobius sp. AArcel1]|uniref:hypothetical protein n=1 Tax=Natronolimnobius sp. AArcel1 TaxID=1679093 RepID=UPI0013ED09BA|nr:hypothetical protein [Natronolimnobius sp. AArcel1]NGM70018.1 hypothetical protein [Natronolimnobius sp. AArcel1]